MLWLSSALLSLPMTCVNEGRLGQAFSGDCRFRELPLLAVFRLAAGAAGHAPGFGSS